MDNTQFFKRFPWVEKVLDCLRFCATVMCIIYLLAGVIFGISYTTGWSMYPTLKTGGFLITRRICYEPKHGDLVIAKVDLPERKVKYLTKRVIGLPGDTIYIDTDTATVYRNGEPLDEPYLGSPTTEDGSMLGRAVTVAEGHVFLMGDNRQHSSDSRSAIIGEIPIEDLQKVILVLFRGRGSPPYE